LNASILLLVLAFVQQKTEKEGFQGFAVDGVRAEHFVKFAQVCCLAVRGNFQSANIS